MPYHRAPYDLTWAEADPRSHPFDGPSARAAVAALGPARAVPVRPAGAAADGAVIRWSHGEGRAWTDTMTEALADHFGDWALGWRWAHDEGDIGGGPVGGWCCPRDSITTPDATLTRVATALCEWRTWLEELAEHFDRYRLDTVPAEDRQQVWERAAVHLVTQVVDRTGAGDAWYGHCEQVLTWFLTRWGVPAGQAQALVAEAIGGRFESWTGPEPDLLDDVAQRLAHALGDADGT
ncbi:hypothetical protein AB0D08_35325 [Kitasatospora sp. NPDC048540]|uniref:hypothetical protein n=1 Tax=Kitasatospora sp. NPDC048540 TaxID=3155634 RepID=UPI0033C0DFC0